MKLQTRLLLLFFCLFIGHAKAQNSGHNLTKLGKDTIIANIGQYFEDNYVFPKQGVAIKDGLNKQNAAGAFNSMLDPLVFRRAVQVAIRNIVDDKHIIFIYTGPQEDKNEASDPSEQISDLKSEFEGRKAINFGIPELSVLENNIGYLKITKFTSPELMAPVMRASSEYLKNVDGLILDLRSRGGGRSESVVLLLSYFLPPDTQIFYWKDKIGKKVETNWTHPFVDGHRFTDIPITVLTSENTFSGSEAFCYVMKHHGLATLIGEKTRGGAHTYKEMFPSEEFLILVPYQRIVSAKTDLNWEGIGVAPHIPTTAEDALEAAKKQLMASIKKN